MKYIARTSETFCLAKLVHGIEDVSWLVQTLKKYGKIAGGIDNSYGDAA